jgi:predicted transcriptional regulator
MPRPHLPQVFEVSRRQSGVVRVNYDIDDELHRRAKTLASSQGRTFKAWLERAIAAEVERQETERAEDERRRRRSR